MHINNAKHWHCLHTKIVSHQITTFPSGKFNFTRNICDTNTFSDIRRIEVWNANVLHRRREKLFEFIFCVPSYGQIEKFPIQFMKHFQYSTAVYLFVYQFKFEFFFYFFFDFATSFQVLFFILLLRCDWISLPFWCEFKIVYMG